MFFSGRQLGLVQEETLVVFYARMPRDTVRTTWNEVEIRKKFSSRSKHPLQYRKWKTQTDEKSLNSLKASPVTEAENSLSVVGKMEISSCDYRHHPVCRGYKSGNVFVHGYRCLCPQADGKSNLSARSKIRYSRISCILKEKNVQGSVSQNSAPMNSILRRVVEMGSNASAGHTWNSRDAPGTKLNSGKKKTTWRNYPKRWTSWAKSLRA